MRPYQTTDRRYPHRWCHTLHPPVLTLMGAMVILMAVTDPLTLAFVGVFSVAVAAVLYWATRRSSSSSSSSSQADALASHAEDPWGPQSVDALMTPRAPLPRVWEPHPVFARLAVAGDMFFLLVMLGGLTALLHSSRSGASEVLHAGDLLSWSGGIALVSACVMVMLVELAHRHGTRPAARHTAPDISIPSDK